MRNNFKNQEKYKLDIKEKGPHLNFGNKLGKIMKIRKNTLKNQEKIKRKMRKNTSENQEKYK